MSLIKSYLHTKMTQTTDNIIDRDALQDHTLIIDGMDLDNQSMMSMIL